MMDLTGFKGFSQFHEGPEWENESKAASNDRKGEITIRFYDYRINEGIPDFILKRWEGIYGKEPWQD